jgi:lysophospholipase L1-like esterase
MGSRLVRWALQLLLLLAITASFAAATLVAYIKWAEYSGHNVVPLLREQRLIKRVFTRPAFVDLAGVVSEGEEDRFPTTWDFDQGIALSTDMFIRQEMFGEPRYRYRANIGVHNVIVWTGLYGQPLAVPATAEISAALARNRLVYDAYFETDDHGFKKTEFACTPESFTLFFLGDSFTEGLWVTSAETFANQVGRKLQSTIPSVTPVNLGVDGYGVLEMDWMLEQFAPELNPRMAIVNLFPNDVTADYVQAIKGTDVPEENYQQMLHYLSRIRDFCATRNIALVVAVLPPKEQLTELREFSAFQDRVRTWCEGQGLLFLDPRDYFLSVGVDQIYFSWDPHLSPRGHEAYAEFLLQQLRPLLIPG